MKKPRRGGASQSDERGYVLGLLEELPHLGHEGVVGQVLDAAGRDAGAVEAVDAVERVVDFDPDRSRDESVVE